MTRIKSKPGKFGAITIETGFELTPRGKARMKQAADQLRDKMDSMLVALTEVWWRFYLEHKRGPTQDELEELMEDWWKVNGH